MDIYRNYKNKKVLITGNTGFKGVWLTAFLKKLGAIIYGYSLNIPTSPSAYEILDFQNEINSKFDNVNDYKSFEKYIVALQPDYIFHLAGQSITLRSFEQPFETFQTNSIGTLHLLEILRVNNIKSNIVLITSDKCYENNDLDVAYKESDRLGGKDPYSASKSIAELIYHSYYSSYFSSDDRIRITSVRAGNIFGGGDFTPQRLIPDCMLTWSKNVPVGLRSIHATRPWQFVLDPIYMYVVIGSILNENNSLSGDSFNIGPEPDNVMTVNDIVGILSKEWGANAGFFYEDSIEFQKESILLKLDISKAKEKLNFKPKFCIENGLKLTVHWYKSYFNKSVNMNEITDNMINEMLNANNV